MARPPAPLQSMAWEIAEQERIARQAAALAWNTRPEFGEQTLHQRLRAHGFTTLQATNGRRRIVDGSGATVLTATANDAWVWLAELEQAEAAPTTQRSPR